MTEWKQTEAVWADNRSRIFETVLKQYHIHSDCSVCAIKEAVISCKDCNQMCFCANCDQERHEELPLHNRISHVKGFVFPLTPLESYNESLEIQHTGITAFYI